MYTNNDSVKDHIESMRTTRLWLAIVEDHYHVLPITESVHVLDFSFVQALSSCAT